MYVCMYIYIGDYFAIQLIQSRNVLITWPCPDQFIYDFYITWGKTES